MNMFWQHFSKNKETFSLAYVDKHVSATIMES